MNDNDFRSGFIPIIGKTNMGKSTLLNTIAGDKVSIVSFKPNTTRNSIKTIVTFDDSQLIFIDTPGFNRLNSKLGGYMTKSLFSSIASVDVILYLVEPDVRISVEDKEFISTLNRLDIPVFLIINKIDKVEKEKILEVINAHKNLYNFTQIIPISALKGDNVDILIKNLKKLLPRGPQYFPDNMITEQPERQLFSEFIREKVLLYLREEIPHGIAIYIDSIKDRLRGTDNITDVVANIVCEKDTHKGIIIGKQGTMLKKIGFSSRLDIEKWLGGKVNLQLFVKVKKNWRENELLLKNYGYDRNNL